MDKEVLEILRELKGIVESKKQEKYQNSRLLFNEILEEIIFRTRINSSSNSEVKAGFEGLFDDEKKCTIKVDGLGEHVEVDLQYVKQCFESIGLHCEIDQDIKPTKLDISTNARELTKLLAKQEKLSADDENKIDTKLLDDLKAAIVKWKSEQRKKYKRSYGLYKFALVELIQKAIDTRMEEGIVSADVVFYDCSSDCEADLDYITKLFNNLGVRCEEESYAFRRNNHKTVHLDEHGQESNVLVASARIKDLLDILAKQEEILKQAEEKKKGFVQIRKEKGGN